jgi:hypothetical protein
MLSDLTLVLGITDRRSAYEMAIATAIEAECAGEEGQNPSLRRLY